MSPESETERKAHGDMPIVHQHPCMCCCRASASSADRSAALASCVFEVRLRAPRHSLRRRAPLREAKTQVVSGACSSPLCSLAAGAPASGADRSAALASSVFEGVRSKMKQLQATVDVRDHRIAALEADMQAAAQEHRDALREAQQRQKAGAAWGCSVCLMG